MIAEGTPPARFAREHAHYDVDLPFWRALAADAGSPVLDLGAAVGRVAIPLARDGAEVWAVDGSAGMIAELRRALGAEPAAVAGRVRTVVADLRRLTVGRTFPLAVMPMNTLQTLLTREDQLACLGRVRDHLNPDGEFVFDLVLPDLDAIGANIGVVQPGDRWRDPDTGVTINHSAWYDAVDPETATVTFTTRVDEVDPSGRVESHLRPQTVHLFSPTEIWELVHEAGMEVRAAFGDFDGAPLDVHSDRQIYRCGVAS